MNGRGTPSPADSAAPSRLVPDAGAAEPALAAVERAIASLGDALAQADAGAVESATDGLQAALRGAMGALAALARGGAIPAELRQRLAAARGQVGVQREAISRAAAGVEQHLEILLPRSPASASVYGPQGAGRGPGRMLAAS